MSIANASLNNVTIVTIILIIVTAAVFVPLAAAAFLVALFAATLAAFFIGALTAAFVPDGIRHHVEDLDRFERGVALDDQLTTSRALLRGLVANDET